MDSLISVIIPIYNVEKYINTCIDSILNQTYKNLEIILVNDGSTDNSKRICDEYAKIDKRIKVVHKENGGAASARNTGLQIAQGDYIGFVDSDDIISDLMYETLLKYIIINEADIAGCYSTNRKSNLFDSKDTITDSIDVEIIDSNVLLHYLKYEGHAVWSRIYKKELFADLRFEENEINEDILMSYKLMKKSKKFIKVNKIFYFWNLEPNSISRSPLKSLNNESSIVLKSIIESREKEEVRVAAKLREIQFNYRLITKYLSYGCVNHKLEKELQNNLAGYIKDFKIYKKEIKASPLFRKKDRVQISLICFSFSLYRVLYVSLKKICNYSA